MNCKCEEKKCEHWIEDELTAADFFERERLSFFRSWIESDDWKDGFDDKEEAYEFGKSADIEFFISQEEHLEYLLLQKYGAITSDGEVRECLFQEWISDKKNWEFLFDTKEEAIEFGKIVPLDFFECECKIGGAHTELMCNDCNYYWEEYT